MPHIPARWPVLVAVLGLATVTTPSWRAPVAAVHADPKLDRAKDALTRKWQTVTGRYAKLDRKTPTDVERDGKDLDRAIDALASAGAAPAEVAAERKRRAAWTTETLAALAGAAAGRVRATVDPKVVDVQPAPGVAAIKPAPPTWCDGVVEAFGGDKKIESFRLAHPVALDGMLAPTATYKNVILFGCIDAGDPVRQRWLAAWRQQLSNIHGLSVADNERVMAYLATAAKAEYARDRTFTTTAQTTTCDALPVLPPDALLEARASRVLERVAVGCGDPLSQDRNLGGAAYGVSFPYWALDQQGGVKSQLARAGLVRLLLQELFEPGQEVVRDGLGGGVPVALTIQLDPAAFERELAKLGGGDHASVRARLVFNRARVAQAELRAAIKRLGPAVEQMFVTAPAAAVAAWEQRRAGAVPLLDMVSSIEDRLERPASELTGCAKALYPQLVAQVKQAVAADPAVKLTDLRFDGLAGFQLTHGLTACARRDADAPVLDEVMAYYMDQAQPARGPLSAAYQGMVDAYNQAQGDAPRGGGDGGGFDGRRRGAPATSATLPTPPSTTIVPPALGQSIHGFTTSYDPTYPAGGVVKTVKPSGGEVSVTFRVEKYKEPILQCVETNKIQRITLDGEVIYKTACKIVGERDATTEPRPFTAPAWAMEGVKEGVFLRYATYPNGVKPDRGWPLEVRATAKATARIALLGVKL